MAVGCHGFNVNFNSIVIKEAVKSNYTILGLFLQSSLFESSCKIRLMILDSCKCFQLVDSPLVM